MIAKSGALDVPSFNSFSDAPSTLSEYVMGGRDKAGAVA